jgi:hypothetical protein
VDNRALTQIRDLIAKNNNIGIAVGKDPGVDEMASALSLYLALTDSGKNVTVACPTDPLVEHSRLVGIDKVKKSFDAGGADMTVSFPYQEGEIEKISYTLEDGLLNIIVKAGQDGLSFSEKDVMFRRSGGDLPLLFVIGTPRLSDLDRLYDPSALKDTTVVNIDNKPDNQGYGDVSIVSPSSSSISEKIADLLFALSYNIDVDIAQNILTGIETATENFQSSRTTSLAFEITGELIRKGAVRNSHVNQPAQNPRSFIPEDQFIDERFEEPEQVAQPMPQPRGARPGQPLRTPQSVVEDLRKLQGQGPAQNVGPQDLEPERKDRRGKKPPVDWLTPKIYKGSTNI